jgi:hypothetical protein
VACPSATPDPYGSLVNGIGVVDRVKVLGALPDGAFAEWRFVAPAGTSIVAASITRDIGNRDEWTPYGRIDGVDRAGESCVPGMGEAFCRIQGTRVFTGLNASTIAYGVRCVVAPYCAHGATLRSVWVLVLGATVTLDDRQAPTVSTVDVGGVGGGAWWNRGGSVSFSAEDNTGLRRRRVVVDGVSRVVVDAPSASAGGCGQVGVGVAYSYSRPCADGRGLNGVRSVAVQPCQWGDGAHSVRGVAVDTGGLEATSSTGATLRVDCTPPSLTLTPGAAEVVEGALIDPPVVEAFDAASGVGATAIELSVDGGAWIAVASSPAVAEAGRTYAFRARARDVAGNWSGWRTAHPVAGVAAPPPHEEEEEEAPPPAAPGGDEAAQEVPAPALEAPVAELGAAVELAGAAELGAAVEPADAAAPGAAAGPGAAAAPSGPGTGALRRFVARLRDPRLRITHVLTRRRHVEVRGTAARALATTGRVTLRTARGAERGRTVRVANGRWRTRFRRSARAHRPRTVAVATRATATHAAGAARWRAP